jgi:sarcosine oxidase, subunit gamma
LSILKESASVRDVVVAHSAVGSDSGRTATRADAPGASLFDHPLFGKINLRGDPEQPEFFMRGEAVLRVPLTMRPGETAVGGENTALRLAADEWLILTPPQRPASLIRDLRERLRPLHASAIDVSCSSVAFRLSGDRAPDILARGCSLDLRRERFTVGRCAQTRIARFAILIHHAAVGPIYDLYVARSFARSFRDWLVDALAEFS